MPLCSLSERHRLFSKALRYRASSLWLSASVTRESVPLSASIRNRSFPLIPFCVVGRGISLLKFESLGMFGRSRESRVLISLIGGDCGGF